MLSCPHHNSSTVTKFSGLLQASVGNFTWDLAWFFGPYDKGSNKYYFRKFWSTLRGEKPKLKITFPVQTSSSLVSESEDPLLSLRVSKSSVKCSRDLSQKGDPHQTAREQLTQANPVLQERRSKQHEQLISRDYPGISGSLVRLNMFSSFPSPLKAKKHRLGREKGT